MPRAAFFERSAIASRCTAGRAQEIAQQILQDLDRLEQAGALEVWTAHPGRSLAGARRYEDAKQAVDVYIHHPAMTAFEVSSTFRQFDQVLELGGNQRGKPILSRCVVPWNAIVPARCRPPASARSLAAEWVPETARTRPFVIRLGDPPGSPKTSRTS